MNQEEDLRKLVAVQNAEDQRVILLPRGRFLENFIIPANAILYRENLLCDYNFFKK